MQQDRAHGVIIKLAQQRGRKTKTLSLQFVTILQIGDDLFTPHSGLSVDLHAYFVVRK